jgi:Cof subfamily protein (haloacid dehalogenase superfamily)
MRAVVFGPFAMIRLIGIDVDGTLLDGAGEMPAANRAAVEAAVAAGIHVTLVTGRSYPFARPVLEGLPEAVSLIVSNGAVDRTRDGRTLARRLLSTRTARSVLDATRAHRESAALIFDRVAEGQMVFESMDWGHPGRQGYFARNRAHIEQAVPLETALTEDPIQVMFSGDAHTMRALSDWLRVSCADVSVLLTEYVHRDFSLVDVTAPEATKGRALAWRAAELGLGPEAVMAVGDNFNDVDMLEFAGTAVVMGNAAEGLKRRGWHVTGRHDEAGLAQAIARFALAPRA